MMKLVKGSIPENVILMVTEQLLVFPITFSLLLARNLKLIPVIYGVFLVSSILAMVIDRYSPKGTKLWLLLGNTLLMLCCFVLMEGLLIGTLFASIMGILIMLRGLQLLKNRNHNFSFYSFVVVGILSYCISALLLGPKAFPQYSSLLSICATIALISSYFCINMTHLNYERKVIDKVTNLPKLTKNSNITLLVIFSSLVIFVASLGFLDHIWAFIKSIINAIKNVGISIYLWYQGLFKGTEMPFENQPLEMPETPDMVSAEPSQVTVILTTIGFYVGLAALTAGVVIILVLLAKHLKQLFLFLKEKIAYFLNDFLNGRGGVEALDTGYVDEVKSLLEDGESTLSATRKWLSTKLNEERPYILLQSNAERARWLYRHLVHKELKRGLALNETMTSQETLKRVEQLKSRQAEELCEASLKAYTEGRYSRDLEPKNDDIKSFKKFYSSKSSSV